MNEIPTLETSRLILRAHRLDDLPDCIAMWADPEITRYTIGNPSTAQRSWMRMLAYLGHWAVLEFGYWAVEEKSSRRYIGELGFADFKRELKPSIDGVPELGWALARSSHGKGYATEALFAALKWGDVNLKSKRTVCIISPDNPVSLRVAEKCGYREIARTEKNCEPEILFERIGT